MGGSYNQMIAIVMMFVGALFLYFSITGDGKVYEKEYPKAMKEDAKKMLRVFLLVIGIIALGTGLLVFFNYESAYWLGLVIIIISIIVYYFIFRSRFKKYL